jgi:hypothetical protein
MPTLLKWEFTGGDDGSELAKHRGEQRAYAGDIVTSLHRYIVTSLHKLQDGRSPQSDRNRLPLVSEACSRRGCASEGPGLSSSVGGAATAVFRVSE